MSDTRARPGTSAPWRSADQRSVPGFSRPAHGRARMTRPGGVARHAVVPDDLALDDLAVGAVDPICSLAARACWNGVPIEPGVEACAAASQRPGRPPCAAAPGGREEQQQPDRVGEQARDHQQQAAEHQAARCPCCPAALPAGRRRPAGCPAALERLGQVRKARRPARLITTAPSTKPGDQQQQHGEPAGGLGHHGQQPDLQHHPGGDRERGRRCGARERRGADRGRCAGRHTVQCAWAHADKATITSGHRSIGRSARCLRPRTRLAPASRRPTR